MMAGVSVVAADSIFVEETGEYRELRQLLWHRYRLVQMRTRIMNQLQALAMTEGKRSPQSGTFLSNSLISSCVGKFGRRIMTIVINAEKLSKSYRIGERKQYVALRDVLICNAGSAAILARSATGSCLQRNVVLRLLPGMPEVTEYDGISADGRTVQSQRWPGSRR